MAETVVFFRDDDAGEMTTPLRILIDTLLELSIPCHYQVVPEYLDKRSAGVLRQIQSAHRDLVFLNQHGLRHSQELGGQRVATEFAGGRPFADQLRDISEGREGLLQALAESFSADLFTPPCHKYDAATLHALGDLGFDTLSAGVRADWASRAFYRLGHALGRVELFGKRVSYHLRQTPDPRLREVSVSIDVHEAQDRSGHRVDKSADLLWREFEFLRTRLPAVGIMLHHQACETSEKQQALRAFAERLSNDPNVRIVSMHELGTGSSPDRAPAPTRSDH